MKIRTSELTGRPLNWAVHYAILGRLPKDYVENRDNYSTVKGYDIMERYKIQTSFGHGLSADLWFAERYRNYSLGRDTASQQYGPNALLAGMRSLVGSELGEEVEVPDELL